MKTIQTRNVPDDVHATLRMRAAGAGVSLSDYALIELQRVAERPPVADVLRRAGSRAGGARTTDIVTRSGPAVTAPDLDAGPRHLRSAYGVH